MNKGFFSYWKEAVKCGLNTDTFETMFLLNESFTEESLIVGPKEEVSSDILFLLGLDINCLIRRVLKFKLNILSSYDVPQFSNFNDGARKISNILMANTGGLTFNQLGLEFLGERKQGALVKYGENHSKLAASLCLVSISRSNGKQSMVKLTPFGYQFAALGDSQKDKLLKVFILKNPLIQNLLIKANNGLVDYKEEVSFLSEKTILRRESNCRYLMEFLLTGTKYRHLLREVKW